MDGGVMEVEAILVLRLEATSTPCLAVRVATDPAFLLACLAASEATNRNPAATRSHPEEVIVGITE
jgi:hypothetical protein